MHDSLNTFLILIRWEEDKFKDSIVTEDKMWVYHIVPELKQQLLQWYRTHFAKNKLSKLSVDSKNYDF